MNFFSNQMKSQSKRKVKGLERSLSAELLYSKDLALVGYMADLPFNKDNPHAIANDTYNGTEKKTLAKKKYLPTLPGYRLTQPDEDSHHISHIEWLKLKLTAHAWKKNRSYRDIVPRSIIAILLEGQKEKVQLANEFICSIEPYTARRNSSLLNALWYFSSLSGSFFNFLKYLPGYQTAKDLLGALSVGFDTEYDDFTICMWTKLYYLAERYPEQIPLTPEAKSRLLNHLLKFSGSNYEDTIPHTGPFKFWAWLAGYPVTDKGIQNSENHLLMINGSAYLKNQLLKNGLNHNSELEHRLCEHLDEIYHSGLSEFNSIPYCGYTVDALLNLYDFAEEPVKSRAARVLDKIFYDYVIHTTSDGQSFRPIARQTKKIKNQEFMVDDSIRAFMMTWMKRDSSYYRQPKTSRNAMFAFTALTTTYRPPQVVYDLAHRQTGYLAMTGLRHGNAEISYKNSYTYPSNTQKITTAYLLSGGGLTQAPTSIDYVINDTILNPSLSKRTEAITRVQRTAAEVVTRNPVLIIEGSAGSFRLEDSFYLGTEKAIKKMPFQQYWGPGIDSMGKNNSGIYFDTLVGPYPVHIPTAFRHKGIPSTIRDPIAQKWTLYEINPGLRVAVFDSVVPYSRNEKKQVGIVLVLPGECADPQALINTIADENKITALENSIHHIGNSVKFPRQCESVMKNKTVVFDAYADLYSYVICGDQEKQWPLKYRRFIQAPLPNHEEELSLGWSAQSAIQTAPDEDPICELNPNKNAYVFMNLKHFESEYRQKNKTP